MDGLTKTPIVIAESVITDGDRLVLKLEPVSVRQALVLLTEQFNVDCQVGNSREF